MLEVGDLEVRDAGVGEIRVAVAAAGLNRADTLQRRGFYPAPPGVAPDVPGLEFAGEVEQVGAGVTEWKVGDRVMGIVPGAGMATHVVTPAREALRVPQSLSLSDAAAVPEAFLTAYDALFDAQAKATAAATVGTPAEDVDEVARRRLADADLAQWFLHRLGHGIGVEAHEDPYLVSGNSRPLVAGNAFSIEPGFYVAGRWGARLEDIVVATDGGPVSLNQANRELVVVEA